jgi:hypothetical protein
MRRTPDCWNGRRRAAPLRSAGSSQCGSTAAGHGCPPPFEHSLATGRRVKRPRERLAAIGVYAAVGHWYRDCCDRGRSRSSRALLATGRASGGAGAHDGFRTGCDSRAHGVAVSVGGPEFGPPYDGRLLTDDRGLVTSRLPDGRNGRSVAATLPAPVHEPRVRAGSLARYRLAPRRREITFGRRCTHAPGQSQTQKRSAR